MKYLPEESGMVINDELIRIFKLAIQFEGRQSKLARAIGIKAINLSTWLGNNTTKDIVSISWDQWKKIQAYLIGIGLIDADDPRWMLPSQMRERLMALKDNSDVTASQSAVNTGTVNGSMTVNNQGRADAADLKSSIRKALIKTDGMCDACKLKAIDIIESV